MHRATHNTYAVLTDILVLAPVIRRPDEVLVLNVYTMLGRANSLYICCVYAHIDKNVLSAHQVLFSKRKKRSFSEKYIGKHLIRLQIIYLSTHPLCCIFRILWEAFNRI